MYQFVQCVDFLVWKLIQVHFLNFQDSVYVDMLDQHQDKSTVVFHLVCQLTLMFLCALGVVYH